MANALDENWELLLTLFPLGWEQQAILSGALERLRGFDSAADLLRVLLLHVGKGYSLRETVVRARQAKIANVSDVALMKRLRKADEWWRRLCLALLEESGWAVTADARAYNVRVLDGTLIKEPGRTGGQWRLHYSLRLPTLECDHLQLTPAKGAATGETLGRFPAAVGDLVLADRGFCKPNGIAALETQGGRVIVRLNTASVVLFNARGQRFDLLGHVRQVPAGSPAREWPVFVHSGREKIAGRLCLIHKSEASVERARKRILRKAQQGGPEPRPETLEYAAYVMVFTTLPRKEFSAAEVLEWYRVRWQIELVFKRMKSLAALGQLPKHDDRSSRAWLYGKLLVALLGQKLMRLGRDISPWGYNGRPIRYRLAAV